MQQLLRWFATWNGIEVEPGSELSLEFAAWREGGVGLLIVAGACLALLAIFQVYRREGASLAGGARLLLAGLRSVAIVAALLVLLEPNLVVVRKEERPGHSILLLDVSQSMEQRDVYRREGVQDLREAWQAYGVQPEGQSRFELQKALLGAGDHQLVAALARNNEVKAYAFDFGIDAVPAASSGAPPAPRLDTGSLAASGRHTNLGGAVRQALEKSREAYVASVVLLTDGRRNLGPRGAEIARFLEQRKVPHTLVLPIGDPSETQTVELDRVEAPDKVFQRDPFQISAQVTSQGFDLTEVTVRLLRESTEGAAESVGSQTVQIGGDRPQVTVDFGGLTSHEAGVYTYRVELQPPDDTGVVEDHHVGYASVEVLGEQTRVLLVAGGPSHEYRILRNTLTRDKTIELSCWLSSADPNFPQDGNLSIEHLPRARAEIDTVDVMILLDPDASKLPREFCELAAAHVVESGAGLWWVCGEKYTLDALRETANTMALAELLPVVPDLVRADRRIIGFGHAFDRPWPYELTAEGRESKVVRLNEQKEANALLWPRLPGYHFAFPVLRAKPLATTLVRLSNPDLARSAEDVPLVAQQFVGAGRVLFCGTDETYRWRASHEQAYNRYWVKGIRMLFEGRLNAGDSQFEIQTSEDTVDLGESVTLTVEAKDDTYQPLARDFVELQLTRRGAATERLRLDAVPGAAGEFAVAFRPRQTGFYTLAAIGGDGGDGSPVTGTSFQVVPAAVEQHGPADLEELAAIATAPGGQLCRSPSELLEAIGRIPSMKTTEVFRTPHAVWDTWVTIAVILSVLAAEWWLRKRVNLL